MAQRHLCECGSGQHVNLICFQPTCGRESFCFQCQKNHQDHQSSYRILKRNGLGLSEFSCNFGKPNCQTLPLTLQNTKILIKNRRDIVVQCIKAEADKYAKQIDENILQKLDLLIGTFDNSTKINKTSKFLNRATEREDRQKIAKQLYLLNYRQGSSQFANLDQILKQWEFLNNNFDKKSQELYNGITALLNDATNQFSMLLNPLYKQKQVNINDTNICFKEQKETQIAKIKNEEMKKLAIFQDNYKKLKQQKLKIQKQLLLKNVPSIWLKEKSIAKIGDLFKEKFPNMCFMVCQQLPSDYCWSGKIILNKRGLIIIQFEQNPYYKSYKVQVKYDQPDKVQVKYDQPSKLQVKYDKSKKLQVKYDKSKKLQVKYDKSKKFNDQPVDESFFLDIRQKTNVRQKLQLLQQKIQKRVGQYKVNVFTSLSPSYYHSPNWQGQYSASVFGADITVVIS